MLFTFATSRAIIQATQKLDGDWGWSGKTNTENKRSGFPATGARFSKGGVIMEKQKARILIYDIETSPLLCYTWGIWEQNAIKVKDDWQILTVAWKWLGEKKVHVIGQDDLPGYIPGVNDDTAITTLIHGLFDEADIIVAHNGDSFDQKKCQARMMVRGLNPPSPYKQIDTKKLAKRYAAFASNSLKELARQLDVNLKGESGGFETWEGVLAGDPKSWAKMKKYNKQDIPPLEDLYLRFMPWMQNHPAINVLAGINDACPKCGGGPLQSRGLTSPSKTGRRRRYVCLNCGGWSQGRQTVNVAVEYVN